jgi:hypothetical protein
MHCHRNPGFGGCGLDAAAVADLLLGRRGDGGCGLQGLEKGAGQGGGDGGHGGVERDASGGVVEGVGVSGGYRGGRQLVHCHRFLGGN